MGRQGWPDRVRVALRRGRVAGALAFVAFAVVPAGAHAGTVDRLLNTDEEYDAVWFHADAGERNHVTVEVAAKTVTITDSGAPVRMTAEAGCTPVGDRSARCPRRPHLYIELGDEADTIRLSYSAPAHREFAEIYGGEGDDTLHGGPQPETFDGGPGADVIEGGAGDDDVTGGEGPDVLHGGPGSDFVNAHDYAGAASDDIACGRGADAINYDIDATDLAHRDCEKIASVGGGLPLTPTFTASGDGSYVVPCRGIGNGRSTRCTAHIVLRDRAGRVLAEGRGSMRTVPYRGVRMRTNHLRVEVHLTTLGRRLLRGAGHLVIGVSVTAIERLPIRQTTREQPRFRVAWR